MGEGEWLVAEADESDGSLLFLRPEVAVITNVELDHHSHYACVHDVHDVFRRFVGPAAGRRPAGAGGGRRRRVPGRRLAGAGRHCVACCATARRSLPASSPIAPSWRTSTTRAASFVVRRGDGGARPGDAARARASTTS